MGLMTKTVFHIEPSLQSVLRSHGRFPVDVLVETSLLKAMLMGVTTHAV
jgi:hypothetical protein